jgi:Holliday junction resolvasome RuvABC endonuclease subunit
MRLIRLSSKLDEIANSLGIHLVVFEAARHSMPGMQGALVVQSEIQGLIKFWCEKNGINYRGYSPSEIKKHATGKGNSGKPVMLDFAKKKWPDKQFVTNSKGEIDDNEVDAVWLLDLARIEYDSKSED